MTFSFRMERDENGKISSLSTEMDDESAHRILGLTQEIVPIIRSFAKFVDTAAMPDILKEVLEKGTGDCFTPEKMKKELR